MNKLFLVMAIGISTNGYAWNETVVLRPGECIHLGGKNICSPSAQNQQSPVVVELRILEKPDGKNFKICKYGFHKEAGDGPIKGWALYDVSISNSKKNEIFIKMYENHIGKDGNIDSRAENECRSDASRFTEREFQAVYPTVAYPHYSSF